MMTEMGIFVDILLVFLAIGFGLFVAALSFLLFSFVSRYRRDKAQEDMNFLMWRVIREAERED